jgi:hypothetical protein
MNNSPQTMAGLSTISAVFLMIQRCEEMLENSKTKDRKRYEDFSRYLKERLKDLRMKKQKMCERYDEMEAEAMSD